MSEIILNNALSAQEIEDQVFHDGNLRVFLNSFEVQQLERDFPIYAVAFQTYMRDFGARDETTTWAYA